MANRPEQRVIIVDAETGNPVQPNSGANGLVTGQVTLPASSAGSRLIAGARDGRISILVANDSGNAIYVSGSAQVTSTNGLKVPSGSSVTIEGSAPIYAINSSNTSTQLVTYAETYSDA